MANLAYGAVTNQIVVMPKDSTIAPTAIVFARTVKPIPDLQSRTIPPKNRLVSNQRSKRSDDLEKRNAARSIGPVVGSTGTTTPMNAMATQSHPRAMSTTRRMGFLTTVIVGSLENAFPDSMSAVRSSHA